LSVRRFFGSTARLIKLAKKPARDELWLSIKITILGVAAIGVIGYIIKFLSAALQGYN
jgi:protein translocase SEC61 complex gamma subunit